MKTDLFIEVDGRQTNSKALIDMAKEAWKSDGHKVKDLKSMELYFKPHEGKCYYIFNGDVNGELQV